MRVPMQIWQVTYKYKNEVKKIIKIFPLQIHSPKKEKKSLLLPFIYATRTNQGKKPLLHTCIFFLETKSQKMSFFHPFLIFFLWDQDPKNVLFFFSLKKIGHSLSFFLLWDNVSNNILFSFLFLYRLSSLLIEQGMAFVTCVVVGVVWRR